MIEALVKKLSRRQPLSSEEEDVIRNFPASVLDFTKGQLIVPEGTSPKDSSVLLTGLAFRYKVLPDGSRQIVSLHIPGDFADLHSFVLQPIDHSIVAVVPSRVAKVPHKRISEVVERYPRLTEALMWDMALDAATHREWMVGLGRRDAYEQLAHLFCELYYRMKMAGLLRGDGFELPLSQPELGDICGLSTVHVNRSLQALRRDRLVITEKGLLTIPDIAKLSEAGVFDPAYLHLISHPGR
jgi:CRP-like cAMP-binding protein